MRRALAIAVAIGAAAAALREVATGRLTIDLGIGRSSLPLGPVTWRILAPPETVFQVIASPYLERTPRAMGSKFEVLQRGSDMALAAHFTKTPIGKATTVETVRFERPHLVEFRLLRGPVPHVREMFELLAIDGGTELTWKGELETDLWALGRLWGRKVATIWERTVRTSLDPVVTEAERRALHKAEPTSG